jgi:hypothetical protein
MMAKLSNFCNAARRGIMRDNEECRTRLSSIRQSFEEERIHVTTTLEKRREEARARGGDYDKESWNRSIKRKVERLVGNNQVGRAIQKLLQTQPPTSISPDTVKKLSDLNPPGDRDPLPPPPVLAADALPTITVTDLERVPDQWLKDDKSPGPTGWRSEWLHPLIRVRKTCAVIAIIVNWIIQGKLAEDSILNAVLCSSSLVGIPKPDGGIRPICMGESLVRLCTKLVMRKIGMADVLIQRIFQSIQLGVGCEAGVERALLQAQMEMERGLAADVNTVVMLIDMRAAYQLRSRGDIARILYETPTLAMMWPLFYALYRRPTSLLMHSNGQVKAIIANSQGVRQGCCYSALLYSLSVQQLFERTIATISKANILSTTRGEDGELQDKLRRALRGKEMPPLPRYEPTGHGIMDDMTVVAEGEWGPISVRAMNDDCSARSGIEINMVKTLALVENEEAATSRMRSDLAEMGITLAIGHTKSLGGELGMSSEALSDAIYRRELEATTASTKAAAVARVFQRIEELKLSAQVVYILLKCSWLSRVGYLARVTKPEILEKTAASFDTLVHTAAANALKLTGAEREDEHVKEAMARPIKYGGLGLRSVRNTSFAAYLAATIGTCVLNGDAATSIVTNKELNVPTRRAMEVAWREVQQAARQANNVLFQLHDTLQLPKFGTATRRRAELHDLDTLLKSVQEHKEKIALAIEALQDKEIAEAMQDRRRAMEISALKAREDMAITMKAAMIATGSSEDEAKAAVARYKEEPHLAQKPRLRLQNLFTRMGEKARWFNCRTEAAANARAEHDTAARVTRAMNGNTSAEATKRRREAWRTAVAARVRHVRMITLADPTCGVALNALPQGKTSINSHAFTIYCRMRLGVPPLPGVLNCARKRHGGPEFEGLPLRHNKAFEIDPAHWTSCRDALTANGTATRRHDVVAEYLKHVGLLAGSQYIWQPSMSDLVTRAPAHAREISTRPRQHPPPRMSGQLTLVRMLAPSHSRPAAAAAAPLPAIPEEEDAIAEERRTVLRPEEREEREEEEGEDANGGGGALPPSEEEMAIQIQNLVRSASIRAAAAAATTTAAAEAAVANAERPRTARNVVDGLYISRNNALTARPATTSIRSGGDAERRGTNAAGTTIGHRLSSASGVVRICNPINGSGPYVVTAAAVSTSAGIRPDFSSAAMRPPATAANNNNSDNNNIVAEEEAAAVASSSSSSSSAPQLHGIRISSATTSTTATTTVASTAARATTAAAARPPPPSSAAAAASHVEVRGERESRVGERHQGTEQIHGHAGNHYHDDDDEIIRVDGDHGEADDGNGGSNSSSSGSDSSDEEQDRHDGRIRQRGRRHGRAVRQPHQQQRQRASEGDLAFTGRSFNRMVVVDVHIISPLVPSRLKEWTSQQRFQHATDISLHINEAEMFKRQHYCRFPMQFLGKTRAEINDMDPLASMDIELVPAVLTQFGTIGPALDKLLRRLAVQAVEIENEERGTPSSDLHDRMRVRVVHSHFRQIIAAGSAQAVAASFSARPQRVNV